MGRKTLSEMVLHNANIQNILKLHTDGLLVTKPLRGEHKNKTQTDIGELGFEGVSHNCVVVHLNKTLGEFKT